MVFDGTRKIGGLIHVVPESRDALAYEICIERSPPLARGFPREIREHCLAGPYDADVNGAIWILHKVIARNAFVVRLVTRIWQIGDVQIRNEHRADMLVPSGP